MHFVILTASATITQALALAQKYRYSYYDSLILAAALSTGCEALSRSSLVVLAGFAGLGSLHWQSEDNPIGYGEVADHEQLLKLAKQIKTFTEGAESSDMLSIHTLMMSSPRIVFLGFAFHERNMELLLSKSSAQPATKYIYGTAYGMSDDSTDSICTDLVEAYKQVSPVLRNNRTCYELLHDLERRLSFA